MPIDYQQISAKIREIGAGAQERLKNLSEKRNQVHQVFTANASQLEFLQQKVAAATAVDPNLRCALPLTETLNTTRSLPPLEIDATLIAVDGSQINPDRHAAHRFGVINIGAILMKRNSGKSPEIVTDTKLFFDMELERNGLTSEGAISLRRDLLERSVIDDLSQDVLGPVVNITDGTLEIWGAKDIDDPKAYEQSVHTYLKILSRLQSRGLTIAGYVDKPSANLVVRLLEVTIARPENLQNLRSYHPFQGVSDLWLFGSQNDEFRLLGPDERSAVFRLQSGSDKYYRDDLVLNFFYLNVSDSERVPQIARIEIPRWVVDDSEKLNLLHGLLIEQCRMLGNRPYPYLLNRAHEIAVVGNLEKEQIGQLLTLENQRHGESAGLPSNKQVAKDSLAAGRRRYS